MQEPNAQFRSGSLILTTSLRIPRLHEGLITRPILMGKMDQVLDFPLTLISAPAGFGKTTLLSQWVSAGTHGNLKGRVAWVSLESEWDARQFWTYIVTSLQEVQPEIGESALASLENSESPIHAVVRTLINEISEIAQDFVLILDDYHHIDESVIHATLTFFIDHLPSNMHLVIASRSQPPLHFARWRASNHLYELREADLRFTEREIAAFFNEIKGLDLLPEEIAALETRTEGWIAGLQLVALSIQSYDDQSKRRFVSAFTGSQRYILDYLIEEVLLQQPDHIRSFLRRTSILDRLSASLCNAVTGQNDGQAILEYLERAHIFTIPLDHQQQWYRYHHLFKDVLYHQLLQLESDSVLELHRRASAWFIQAGRTDEAIRHAFAAKEWDQAIELIEPAIQATWNRGEIRKVINWLGRLPASRLDLHPTLSLYYSRALLLGGRMDAAEQRLLESEKVLRERLTDEPKAQDRLLLGTICAFRTTIAAVTGETTAAQALGNEALRLLPPDQLDIRAHALTSLGVSYYYSGDMDRATQACSESVRLAQRVGNLYLAMAAASYQAHTLECKGQFRQAMQILEQALDLSKTPGLPVQSLIPAASAVCASYGSLLYEWNQLDESEKYLTLAIELGQRLAFGSALWYAYHMLGRIKLAQGDQKRAEAMIEQTQMYQLTYTVPLPKRLMDAEHARASLALGQREFVERWATSLPSDRTDTPGFIQEVEDMALARFYLLQNRPEAALTLLDRLRLSAESGGRIGHLIPALALTAVAQHAQGDTQAALDTLQTALTIAEPEGYLRTFVDEGPSMAALLYQALAQDILPEYVRRLLAIFPAEDALPHSTRGQVAAPSAASAEMPLIERLSEREVEVLQLMASGASNQEIAESLVIAITTAKKHVSNIIRKLGADNRTQAAAKGRNLGLCD